MSVIVVPWATFENAFKGGVYHYIQGQLILPDFYCLVQHVDGHMEAWKVTP